ncbi:MAG: 2OG-Fe(II) oxygenase [Caulobacteraceae bacterium]|nr:2OG-Fe(II) oxygenase [Caulobacteraceae bacterium]
MPADGDLAYGGTDVASALLASLEQAERADQPFAHWLLEDALPARVAAAIAALPFDPPTGARFDGRRETNNSSRVYVSPEVQARFPVCRKLADGFRDPRVIAALEVLTGARLAAGRLRIEYCQDVDGFWLEPHVDIPVKLFTLLIYLSDDPALADAGTDIYDASPEHRPAGRADYALNRGLIFIPGRDTWHGFTPRPIHGVRKSIIVNYVTDAWRATEELA